MFVVIYTARAKSPEEARALCGFLDVNIFRLSQMPGYLQAQCGIRVDDPCALIALIFWGSQPALHFELLSKDHQQVFAELGPHLAGPPVRAVYEIL